MIVSWVNCHFGPAPATAGERGPAARQMMSWRARLPVVLVPALARGNAPPAVASGALPAGLTGRAGRGLSCRWPLVGAGRPLQVYRP